MSVVRGLLTVAYPFLIFAGLRWIEPRWLALLLGFAVLFRTMMSWHRPSSDQLRRLMIPALLMAAVLGLSVISNDARYLLFVPFLMNAALLVAFGRTLRAGPPLVETFARLREPEISDAHVRYCRSVTIVWCVFFVANGAVCLWLAVEADLWMWALYTGLISYMLMGLLFSAEFVLRSWRFRKFQGTLVEPLFRRLFPQGPPT